MTRAAHHNGRSCRFRGTDACFHGPWRKRVPKTVIAGERYTTPPGGQTWALGTNYRDLWAAPIDVEVLNLQNFAGGLLPVRRVGGEETLGLAMKGRGRSGLHISFRGQGPHPCSSRDVSRTALSQNSPQDQIAANVPGVEAVVHPFADAVGVLEPESRLVVMPDDPALGEYQKDFAGVLGVFLEYPQAVSDTNPGFRGATEIQGHDEFWELRQKGPENLADTRAFLRARLLDIFLGDWDRHSGQWRWARIPGKPHLQPKPEDRDQVFCDFEGFALDTARLTGSQMVLFEENYPEIALSTQNGWDLDRFLLTNIERSEWMEIAGDMQSRLTDDVIEAGLRRPSPGVLRPERRGARLHPPEAPGQAQRGGRSLLQPHGYVYRHPVLEPERARGDRTLRGRRRRGERVGERNR